MDRQNDLCIFLHHIDDNVQHHLEDATRGIQMGDVLLPGIQYATQCGGFQGGATVHDGGDHVGVPDTRGGGNQEQETLVAYHDQNPVCNDVGGQQNFFLAN